MKTIQGAYFLAWSKRSLTRDAPTPTNISTNSDPDTEKNGTPASPAIALAMRVFPQPGGPTSNTPFGIFAPYFVNFLGFFKNSIISFTSSFTSSAPATSLNVICGLFSKNNFALLFPKLNAWLPEEALFIILCMKNHHNKSITIQGTMFQKSVQNVEVDCCTSKVIPLLSSLSSR